MENQKEIRSFILRAALFLLIGAALMYVLHVTFLEKTSYGRYRNYLAQEDVDVLILGSSHSANALSPTQMEKLCREQGRDLNIFNYSIYGMRIEQMYYFFLEALKKHTPKILILETFAFVPLDDESRDILARRAFDMLPLSRNKIRAIRACAPQGGHWSYYFPFLMYHSRWKELSEKDFKMPWFKSQWDTAGKKGVSRKDRMEQEDDYFHQPLDLNTPQEINSSQKAYLEKLLQIAEEKGIKVVMTCVPFKEQLGMDARELAKINLYLENTYADGEQVHLLDMNRMWDELDFDYGDLYNEGHCNRYGAKKASAALAEYLMEQSIV